MTSVPSAIERIDHGVDAEQDQLHSNNMRQAHLIGACGSCAFNDLLLNTAGCTLRHRLIEKRGSRKRQLSKSQPIPQASCHRRGGAAVANDRGARRGADATSCALVVGHRRQPANDVGSTGRRSDRSIKASLIVASIVTIVATYRTFAAGRLPRRGMPQQNISSV